MANLLLLMFGFSELIFLYFFYFSSFDFGLCDGQNVSVVAESSQENVTEIDSKRILIEFEAAVDNLKNNYSRKYNDTRLRRIKAKQTGQEREIRLVPGTTHILKTVGSKPPIFEIPNFLNSSECDHLINLAKEAGLVTSGTHIPWASQTECLSSLPLGAFKKWDTDGNKKIDMREALDKMQTCLDFNPTVGELTQVFQKLMWDINYDGFISPSEFQRRLLGKQIPTFLSYINKMKKDLPHRHATRQSENTFIVKPDPVIRKIKQRLFRITGLPIPMIESSEHLQVVKYKPGGHYNCHMDSSNEGKGQGPCCHHQHNETEANDECTLCRFMTVLYFLNDVELGGETAFPVADSENITLAEEELKDNDDHNSPNSRCNLARYCKKSNVVVKPEKGKAVLWYSHFVYKGTGWTGILDPLSTHGGCAVLRGSKWIANNWINAGISKEDDIKNWAYVKVKKDRKYAHLFPKKSFN